MNNRLTSQARWFLQHLYNNRQGLRSNEIASKMALGNGPAAAVGLGLRDAGGYVQSINDGQAYNLWMITTKGICALNAENSALEAERQAAIVAQQQAAKPKVKTKYILWNPKSSKPPKVVHDSYDEAMKVAAEMATKNPGEDFFVCELKTKNRVKSKRVVTQELEVTQC